MEYAIEDVITSALSEIRGVKINEAAVKARAIRPSHVVDVVSSKGLEEGKPYPEFAFPVSGTFPYDFDIDGFGRALHAALKDQVAGYVMQLSQHGRAIYALQWNWAKRPWGGSDGRRVRMHIASCSKLVTAIAMTKLLDEKQMSYDTPIAGFLPSYWVKGPNVNAITFRHLMTHTSGFDTGKSDSDFEFMKNRVAPGVSGTGTYSYHNMSFGLCQLLHFGDYIPEIRMKFNATFVCQTAALPHKPAETAEPAAESAVQVERACAPDDSCACHKRTAR
jgi:hypothetical protein